MNTVIKIVALNALINAILKLTSIVIKWRHLKRLAATKVCRDLIRLSGVDRLVELCQNRSERNYSDAVLVSCLAVLRRLNANLEQSEELQSILHQLKALNLIRTNLVDSFMEYSTKQESLV